MVFASRRCGFRQANRKVVQRIASEISRAITVEEGMDLSYPQNKESYRQQSFPAYLHHSSTCSSYGAHGYQEIPILLVTNSNSTVSVIIGDICRKTQVFFLFHL